MRTPEQLHGYQVTAIRHQCTHPQTMLWQDPGLGKTIETLTSISHLITSGFLKAVLVVAPLRVARLVWRQEAANWSHTKHLTFSMVMGSKDQRVHSIMRPANVYLINFENIAWLMETLDTYFLAKGRPLPFDGLVWDEINKMKNSTTHRVKAVRKVTPSMKWITGLTGTPVSNGYQDLHGQFLVVDGGVRLGTSKTAFRTRFYKKISAYKEVPYPDSEDTIKKLISDITLEMSAADYNPLPDLIVNNIKLEMPPALRATYDKMEKEFFIKLDSGTEVEMFNQAALTNKCLQFSNGAMYPVAGMPLWEPVHSLKLDALEEILDEAQGQPVLCSYAYRSDAQRIMERFHGLDPINLTECHGEKMLTDAMRRWVNGDCRLMIGHPACLHPSTQVLTELRGWVRLIDVTPFDRVFDGVEFVSHDGCSYSGCQEVIDVIGITMTPDHKLMVSGQWMEAQDVRDREGAREEALYEYQGDDEYVSSMLALRGRVGSTSPERDEAQPGEETVVSGVRAGPVPQHDRDANLAHLAGASVAGEGHPRQELRGPWHRGLRGVGEQFRSVLHRYVRRILGRFDDRTYRRKRTLLKRELYLGDAAEAAGKQAHQSVLGVSGGADTPGRIVSTRWGQQDDAPDATEPRDVSGRSSAGCSRVPLRERTTGKRTRLCYFTNVYDLMNCGPRHRFVIRNDVGDVFISHNSMGHGIDGLQKTGHIVVWFGLNWSLDLYEQMNARVRRQGQGVPVIAHRILIKDTLDQAQALALDIKAQTQSGLRDAVKQYRLGRGM